MALPADQTASADFSEPRNQECFYSCASLAQEMPGAHLESTIKGAASSERGLSIEIGGRSVGKLVVDVRRPGDV